MMITRAKKFWGSLFLLGTLFLRAPSGYGADVATGYDPSQYALLARCVRLGDMAEWNRWMKNAASAGENSSDIVRLQGASFENANLQGVFLEGAHLQGANFYCADLRGARLGQARLEGANFYSADLRGTDFSQAKMLGVNLLSARLQGAKLHSADLSGASFHVQDFEGAELEGAVFYAVNSDEAVIRFCKPVLYLYPPQPTEVKVVLDYDGTLECTYPAYREGWTVTAYPDGKLINHADGLEYSYLFWEGKTTVRYDFSKGFVVKGSDTAAFLQEKLALLGLTPREYNEFIVYWLPLMQNNPYNLVAFQEKNYTDSAVLTVDPEPDSVLRVFMAFMPLKLPVELPPQEFKPFERKGFTLVEWGGGTFVP